MLQCDISKPKYKFKPKYLCCAALPQKLKNKHHVNGEGFKLSIASTYLGLFFFLFFCNFSYLASLNVTTMTLLIFFKAGGIFPLLPDQMRHYRNHAVAPLKLGLLSNHHHQLAMVPFFVDCIGIEWSPFNCYFSNTLSQFTPHTNKLSTHTYLKCILKC